MNIKKYLFGFILILLFASGLQTTLNIFNIPPLEGAITYVQDEKLTSDGWFNGEFQAKKAAYLNQQFSFRPDMVRLYNQIHYSFFDKAKAKDVIIGKEDYLFEKNYIYEHLGLKFAGEKMINDRVTEIKKLKDLLFAKGKHLVVVIGPNKASYFNEYIPDKYLSLPTGKSNYVTYKKLLEAADVNTFDMHSWFNENKEISKYPLYSKTGIHWSMYGASVVVDSLIHFIEEKTTYDLPEFVVDTFYLGEPRHDDNDLGKGMNLMRPITDFTLAYPRYHYEKSKTNSYAKILTIGDSYHFGLYTLGISREAFNNGSYWYYNNEIFSSTKGIEKKVKDVDLSEQLNKNDVVILLATSANIHGIGSGVVGTFNKVLSDKNSKVSPNYKEMKIQESIVHIKNDPKWFASIHEKAKINKLTIDEALRVDAEWLYLRSKGE